LDDARGAAHCHKAANHQACTIRDHGDGLCQGNCVQ
jgi:hypothetical protein